MAKLTLNCDMGESFGPWKMGNDAEIMPFIDQANIACGFHASDPNIMAKTVQMALEHNVEIGAHPGFDDLKGFGRRVMRLSKSELENTLLYQIGALEGICKAYGGTLGYVKPHGALYNLMMEDSATLNQIMETVARYKEGLPLVVMATPDRDDIIHFSEFIGVPIRFEAFCDRAYQANGQLVPRSELYAVHDSLEEITKQAKQLSSTQSVTCISGETLSVHADTLCIHGDSPLALETVKALRK